MSVPISPTERAGQRGGRGAPTHPTHDPGNRRRRGQRALIILETKKRTVRVRLGDGAPSVTSGLGGYVEVTRPADVSLTEWQGVGPFRIDVPVLLDGFADNESIEGDLDDLLFFGAPHGSEPPPVFHAHGAIPFSGERMVFESTPEWGDSLRNRKGKLVRQALVLHLMQYVAPDRIKISRQRHAPEDLPSTYATKKGDTLNKLSIRFYGDTSRAAEIGAVNGLRNPRKPIDPGTTIRLLGA